MKKYFSAKIKELFDKAGIVSNPARREFIFSFVLGLIKSRKVHVCEVAEHLNGKAKAAATRCASGTFSANFCTIKTLRL